jgi:hypothetical protein
VLFQIHVSDGPWSGDRDSGEKKAVGICASILRAVLGSATVQAKMTIVSLSGLIKESEVIAYGRVVSVTIEGDLRSAGRATDNEILAEDSVDRDQTNILISRRADFEQQSA